jgi:hypothetical protein
MARIFLTNIDLQNNQLVNFVVEKLAADPSSPATARIVFNTTTNKLEYYNGTTWVVLDNSSAAYAADSDKLDAQHGSYYLSRTNHTGTQLAATISDFDAQVRLSRIDQMAVPTASLNLNSQKITGLATPAAATDAVTKAYADGLVGAAGYSANVGNGVLTTITVTHNLGTRDLHVSLWKTVAPYDELWCDVFADTINSIQLKFTTAPATDQFRVCISKA